jgi:hypothetical protein
MGNMGTCASSRKREGWEILTNWKHAGRPIWLSEEESYLALKHRGSEYY